ncbi:MAG: hypothetical protein PWR03_477 [Tenuifilum sp.]|jgi:hypothetical protein|nr:hypothetical protein [Tenuifilum sp.]
MLNPVLRVAQTPVAKQKIAKANQISSRIYAIFFMKANFLFSKAKGTKKGLQDNAIHVNIIIHTTVQTQTPRCMGS